MQDPFLKLWVGRGGPKSRTNVHTDGGHKAIWNENFNFLLEASVVVAAGFSGCIPGASAEGRGRGM